MRTTEAKIPLGGKIVPNLPNAEYHADAQSYSSSQIKAMDIPAKARWNMLHKQNTNDTFMLGSAIHKWILERDAFHEEFLTGINAGRRSKADKQAWADWYSEHGADGNAIVERPAAEWNGEFEAQTGKSLVTPETLQQIMDMADSIQANENAMALLTGGEAELSVYWTDEETGLKLRCRPDYMNSEFITDIKSISSIDTRTIDRSIANYGYGISAEMYKSGCYSVTGAWRPFVFIFIETQKPYLCRVISLSDAECEKNYKKYTSLKCRLADCLRSDEWPGLPDDLDHDLFSYGD